MLDEDHWHIKRAGHKQRKPKGTEVLSLLLNGHHKEWECGVDLSGQLHQRSVFALPATRVAALSAMMCE